MSIPDMSDLAKAPRRAARVGTAALAGAAVVGLAVAHLPAVAPVRPPCDYACQIVTTRADYGDVARRARFAPEPVPAHGPPTAELMP